MALQNKEHHSLNLSCFVLQVANAFFFVASKVYFLKEIWLPMKFARNKTLQTFI